jgi:hypothetical protein
MFPNRKQVIKGATAFASGDPVSRFFPAMTGPDGMTRSSYEYFIQADPVRSLLLAARHYAGACRAA